MNLDALDVWQDTCRFAPFTAPVPLTSVITSVSYEYSDKRGSEHDSAVDLQRIAEHHGERDALRTPAGSTPENSLETPLSSHLMR